MQPIPCAHCGVNFMRHNLDVENEKLCNNCLVREEIRNPKKEKIMETVGILIQCPKQTQIDIEELCINQGIDFSKYFLNLHEANISKGWTVKEGALPDLQEEEAEEKQNDKKKKKKD
jgi:hypothetical protein